LRYHPSWKKRLYFRMVRQFVRYPHVSHLLLRVVNRIFRYNVLYSDYMLAREIASYKRL
jgi:hypothetical protein